MPRGRLLPATVALALVASLLSALAVFPHNLSYFNELAGGPLNGHAHLLDANLDWGQDLLELKRWYEAHPEARPFHLNFFGFVSPKAAGLEFAPVPRASAGGTPIENDSVEIGAIAGWHAISVNELYGYKHFGDGPDDKAWLRQFQPIARAGYSIKVFQLAPAQANRVRRDRQP